MAAITFCLEVCGVDRDSAIFRRTVEMHHIPRAGEYVEFEVVEGGCVDCCVSIVIYHLDGRVVVWFDLVRTGEDAEYRDEIHRRLLASGWAS